MIEEVVLPDRTHVGEQPLARPHAELAQRHPLPLRRRLHDLGVDRVKVAVVRDVKADRRARAVSVEVVVDAARGLDDERDLHQCQVQPLAEAIFDQALRVEEGAHGLPRAEQRP